MRTVRPGLVLTAAGVLVMVLAAVVASRYTPFWFDPDEGCALLGRCPGPTRDVVLGATWVLEWAGLGVVLLGLVRTGLHLRTVPAPPVPRPLPAWAQAAAGVLLGMLVCVVLGWFVLVAVLLSAPAVPAGLCLYWLAQAAAVTALDRHVGPAHRSALSAWSAGLAVSALAVAALVATAVLAGSVRALPVVGGAALALGLLVRRAWAWRAGLAPPGGGPWSTAGAAAAVLATTGAVLLLGDRADQPPGAEPPPELAAAAHPPPARPPAPREPVDAEPAPVDAPPACTPDELTWGATGWDAAMGTRAVTIVATSRADHPCHVDGFAEIVIAQGGRPLQLVAQPGAPTGPEVPPAARVGLAPGDAAGFPLVWKGYGAAADEDSPQELTVILPGGGSSAVPLGAAPAPFDLVDGGSVRIGPWQPVRQAVRPH
ncbi:DUF4232 domain-containing protein [Pseudonocardia kunmingensis]|nr:DUF4232 domain-containing protein [Pseudonocardia kunmingensis]